MPKVKKVKKYKGHIFKRGSVYWLQYSGRNADGKTIRLAESLKTESKPEAESKAEEITRLVKAKDAAALAKTWAVKLKSSTETVNALEADRNRILLVDVWQRFPYDTARRGSIVRPLKPRVAKAYQKMWEAFVAWTEEHRPGLLYIEDVTETDALAYSDYCRKVAGAGPAGLNLRMLICRTVFTLASQNPNPFAKIRKVAEAKEHRDALELSDVQKIVAAATGEIRLLIIIGCWTGLRLGDAVTLRWEDIRCGRIWKKTAKTGREVSLQVFPILADELAQIDQPADGKGYILPELAALYGRDPTAISKRVRHLFESCEIEVTEKIKGRAKAASRRGFHCLRTTFVSLCARAGVPTGAIAEWCGHSPEVDRIYQRWGSKETDARILGALQGLAQAMLPETSLSPAIVVEGREITTKDQLHKIIDEMTEEAAEKLLAKLSTRRSP